MQFPLVLQKTPAAALPGQAQIIESLSALRKDWETAAGKNSLVDVTASVGLLLHDIATKLDLSPEERLQVLGKRLDRELAVVLGE